MGNVFKVQFLAVVIFILLVIQNLYLKFKNENLEEYVVQANARLNKIEREFDRPLDASSVKSQVLIYSRIPKTGSTSFMNVAYEMLQHNNFRVVMLQIDHYKNQLTLGDQVILSQNMSAWRDIPTLYNGHFAYFDPRRVGVDLTPVYISMVRAPLERLVSHYYFLRYGDDILVDKVRAKQGDKTTFDDCVEQQFSDCDPKKMWLQVPYFCGSVPACWEPGSEWALKMAKENLVNKYLLVGITEQLPEFVEVLEQLLPTFFTGAKEFLQISGKAHIKHTRHKEPLSETTITKMKKTKIWKIENEFFNFAQKHFNATRSVVLQQKEAKKQYYKYDKVKSHG